jgi:hypothetical protein
MRILKMIKKISLAGSLLFIIFFSLVLTFASICSSEPAGNKTWEFYGTSKGGGSYYFSKINNAKSSDVTSVWCYKTITDIERKEKIESLRQYKPDESIKYKNYSYNIARIEINCKRKLNRVVESMSYDNKGNILEHGTFDNEWESIIPQSMNEKLYQKNCLTEDKPSIKIIPYKSNWAQYGNIIGLLYII